MSIPSMLSILSDRFLPRQWVNLAPQLKSLIISCLTQQKWKHHRKSGQRSYDTPNQPGRQREKLRFFS